MGDTVEDAIQAAFDHILRRPSRRSALHQPFFKTAPRSASEALTEAHTIRPMGYDYRTTDWTPDMPRED